ncbi:MAG: PEGA domain-containing protein [Gammaproteobacteria bacterium]|nr:PEGA domain-containing protein [Gammaproteobacteria bacterium]
MLNRYLPLLILLSALASGCASMFSGTEQKMKITSDPEGASIYADGLLVGKTPATIKLLKYEYKTITLKKPGYQDENIKLELDYDGINMLNLLNLQLGGIGFTVDASTGAMYEYEPGKFQINMQKRGRATNEGLERNPRSELTMFVNTHFYQIKSQCDSQCNNTQFDTLVLMSVKSFELDEKSARQSIQKLLNESNTPDEFVAQLKTSVTNQQARLAKTL